MILDDNSSVLNFFTFKYHVLLYDSCQYKLWSCKIYCWLLFAGRRKRQLSLDGTTAAAIGTPGFAAPPAVATTADPLALLGLVSKALFLYNVYVHNTTNWIKWILQANWICLHKSLESHHSNYACHWFLASAVICKDVIYRWQQQF